MAGTLAGKIVLQRSPLFRGLPCHVAMVGEDRADSRESLDWARALTWLGAERLEADTVDRKVAICARAYHLLTTEVGGASQEPTP